MLLEANAAKTVDFNQLTAFDRARVPISFKVDATDTRFFPDWKQWQQEPVDVKVGARMVNVRADVFKDAAHRVPFNESSYAAFSSRVQPESPMYTPTPDKTPMPMSPAMALAAGVGIMGDLALGVLAAKSKNKAAVSSWLLLQAPIINGCQTAIATPAAEVTQAPAEVTKVVPPAETITPQPQVSTENAPGGPAEPTLAAPGTWPGPELFPKVLPNREVIPQSDIKAENVLDQFGDVDYTLRYYGKSADLGFVETTNGNYQWAIQATTNGAKSALWPENADGQLFSHPSTANDQDVSAATPVAGYETITPTGIGQDYTLALEAANGNFTYVARSSKDGTILASFFVAPNLKGEWRLATAVTATETATPVEVAKFSIDSLGLAPDVTEALKKHVGLEGSIKEGADGFTTTITYWSADHKLVTEEVGVNPAVMTEDVTSINKFGDTPVMLTSEGQKLYWSQEHNGWFKVEMSPDINNPVFIPYEYRDVALRAVIAEYNKPFSQKALDWFKQDLTQGIEVDFQYLETNANTHASTKFGYMRNTAVGDPKTTTENSPVQPIDAWFVTQLADGTVFQFYPTKWLDPADPLNPKGNEWKIHFAASGEEIMGDAANRAKFDIIFNDSFNPAKRLEPTLIIATAPGFFDSTNSLVTFGAAQPSLEKLAVEANKTFGSLTIPALPKETFRSWIDQYMGMVSPDLLGYGFGYTTKEDPSYIDTFFPMDSQLILYPSMIIQR